VIASPRPELSSQPPRSPAGSASIPRILHLSAGLAALLWFSGCHTAEQASTGPAHWRAWQAQRQVSIGGPNGWSTLVGLPWLAEGANTAGSDPTKDVVFPAGRTPAHVGVFVRQGKSVQFLAAPGVPALLDGQPTVAAALRSDEHGAPSVLTLGGVRMFVVVRGERVGLRVKDPAAPTRRHFRELTYFPYDPARRVRAQFVPYDPPKRQPMMDVTGAATVELCPGALVFTLDGHERRIDALADQEEGDLFLLFRDATSGTTTYGSGRYLHASLPDAVGQVVLDFNFAYNPPCAFTAFATCQIPPRQNWLPVAIKAGEKNGAGAH
jgi:uncharacterized protein (DUF1684 family)